MNKQLANAISHWKYIKPLVTYPNNEGQYKKLVSQLDKLLEVVKDNESHPLMGLVDLMSHIISEYDRKFHNINDASGVNALKYLMQEHNLKQCDLPEIASQGVMSEILSGKRTLNLRQIKLLSKRFSVSPETFMDK